MIPTPKDCLTLVLPTVSDLKYKKLLQNQLKYINLYRVQLFEKIKRFYDFYQKKHLDPKIVARSCNFPLLEEKCLEYSNQMLIKN